MLNCKEVAYLASKQMDTKLVWTKRLQFRFHLWMCKNCAQFIRQIDFLHRAAGEIENSQRLDSKSLSLSRDARERISKRISQ